MKALKYIKSLNRGDWFVIAQIGIVIAGILSALAVFPHLIGIYEMPESLAIICGGCVGLAAVIAVHTLQQDKRRRARNKD